MIDVGFFRLYDNEFRKIYYYNSYQGDNDFFTTNEWYYKYWCDNFKGNYRHNRLVVRYAYILILKKGGIHVEYVSERVHKSIQKLVSQITEDNWFLYETGSKVRIVNQKQFPDNYPNRNIDKYLHINEETDILNDPGFKQYIRQNKINKILSKPRVL